MHKLVAHQLRSAARPDGSIDVEALTALMRRTYDEFDRERRLTDRAAKLMEEELQEANAQVRRLAEQRLADTEREEAVAVVGQELGLGTAPTLAQPNGPNPRRMLALCRRSASRGPVMPQPLQVGAGEMIAFVEASVAW